MPLVTGVAQSVPVLSAGKYVTGDRGGKTCDLSNTCYTVLYQHDIILFFGGISACTSQRLLSPVCTSF